MKRMIRLIPAIILALATLLSAVACSAIFPGDDAGGETDYIDYADEKVDSSRTQLYVSNFNGGYGHDWLYKAKKRFEEEFKDTSFEEGKKGVQIYIDDNKDQGHSVLNLIKNSRNEIFFTQGVNYYDFVNGGLVAEITDIVTETLTKYGETRSVEDKLFDEQKDYLSVGGKYYAIPYCSGYFGIIYDIDLFDQKGFYFAADNSLDASANKYNTARNNGNNGFIYEKTDVKSNGPDGTPGTADDGLPATYDEYFLLCDYIVNAGCIPTIWTGVYRNDYMLDTLRAFAVDYEGDEVKLMYTFDGKATHLVESIDGNGNPIFSSPTQINNSNGYELQRSAGKYYAMKFYQQLTSNTHYYFKKCFNETHSHLDAQADFLFSRAEGNEPIAMMFEGTYWANEASEVFRDVAAQYGEEYDAYHRNFGVMPIPKPTLEQVGQPYTVLKDVSSLGFINANCDANKLALAKLFLQYVNTDYSLREYTVTTNTLKDMDYTLEDSDLAQMTGFGKMLWNSRNGQNSVYRVSKNPVFLNNQAELATLSFIAKVSGTVYNHPVDMLRGTDSERIEAVDFFYGIQSYYDKSWWRGLVGVDK